MEIKKSCVVCHKKLDEKEIPVDVHYWNDCGDLRILFEGKTNWWSRPMLADKIERLCL